MRERLGEDDYPSVAYDLANDLGLIHTFADDSYLRVWAMIVPKRLTPRFFDIGTDSLFIEFSSKTIPTSVIVAGEANPGNVLMSPKKRVFEVPSPKRLSQMRNTYRIKYSPKENATFYYAILIIPFETDEELHFAADCDPDAQQGAPDAAGA